jgi:hypothetical protein
MTSESRNIEPGEKTSIATQRLGNYVSAATNVNKDNRFTKHVDYFEINTGVWVTTHLKQHSKGTVKHGVLYSIRLAIITGSGFVDSKYKINI